MTFPRLSEYILKKRGFRADVFWTHPLVFRTFLRHVPLSADVQALMRSQYWTRERLDAFTNYRLTELIERARQLPLWQHRLHGYDATAPSPADRLRNIPVATKTTYTDSSPEAYLAADEVSRSHQDFTSGSTGRPFGYYFGWRSELRCFAFCERTFYTVGRGARPLVISMRARHRIGFVFWRHLMFFLSASADIAFRLPELISTLTSQKDPVILYGYTSWIIELAKQVRLGKVVVPRIFALVATGEGITPAERNTIEHVFNAPFYTTYATRELGWLGFECEEKRMHVNEEWGFLEILDDDDRPLPAGQGGRIVVTTFDNTVMPFIRYAIGDRGWIDPAPCRCGRTLRTITFSGRQSDTINLGDGQAFSLLDISPLFDAFWDAVHQYQIVHTAPLAFTMRVVPGPAFDERRDALHARMIRAMHPRVEIAWETVASIDAAKSGKAVYYIKTF